MTTKIKKTKATNNNKSITNIKRTFQGRRISPSADILENESDLNIVLDMPGVSKKDINIHLENKFIEISGNIINNTLERFDSEYGKQDNKHFYRRFALSNNINQDKITASLDKGVLNVVLPKVELSSPRNVQIM